MIISKSALQLVGMVGADKGMPMLNSICIEPNGMVIASNTKAIAIVGPVSSRIREAVPLQEQPGDITQQVVLTADTAKNLVKSIPRDTQFKGLLEHTNIRCDGSMKMTAEITDGKRRNEIKFRKLNHMYFDYKPVFQAAWKNKYEGEKVKDIILNRKRLTLVLSVIDKVCNYDGDFSPVFWTFTSGGDVIIKARNELTDQGMIVVFRGVESKGDEGAPEYPWERELFEGVAKKRQGAIKLA